LYTTNSCRNNRAENQQSKVPLSSEQEKLYKRGRGCRQTISTDARQRQVQSGFSGAEKNQKDLT
jgi:Fe-S cluster assembly ATPase SufC